MADSDTDSVKSMEDFSSLLGMSNLLNREEVDVSMNAKVVERELLEPHGGRRNGGQSNSSQHNSAWGSSQSMDYDTNGTDNSIDIDPLDEYNAMIESLHSNQESIESYRDAPEENVLSDPFFSSSHVAGVEHDYSGDMDQHSQPWGGSTMEHSNQKIADQIIPPELDSCYDMADENTSDLKLTLLEKIDNLKEELEDDGVSIEKIPKVDFTSQLSDIEYVAKLLMLKANRNRYSNMGEEFILAFSSILETIFNGKREFFGVAPNLTNCSDIVKVKLRRVKNETSQIVSNVVEKYEISPLTTVLIELLPSIFLHSRRRSIQAAPAWSAVDLSDDINEIRKY
jgi:hypothetical protein